MAPERRRAGPRAFSLIELLVVAAVIALLAAMVMPALSGAKLKSRQIACLSNLRQQGIGLDLYLMDCGQRFPDRRDLKTGLGYKPWTTWPPSDPRGGWAAVVSSNLLPTVAVWACPAIRSSPLLRVEQCVQPFSHADTNAVVTYWLWRFDRKDEPVPMDNFWGKPVEQCVVDLRTANNPNAGQPNGPSEVELTVDPYFPSTVLVLSEELKGRAVHPGGRNRLYLDNHAEFVRDKRLQ